MPNLLIFGDLNIDILQFGTNIRATDFVELIFSYGLLQLVTYHFYVIIFFPLSFLCYHIFSVIILMLSYFFRYHFSVIILMLSFFVIISYSRKLDTLDYIYYTAQYLYFIDEKWTGA